jgi:hypothetical protein
LTPDADGEPITLWALLIILLPAAVKPVEARAERIPTTGIVTAAPS